MNIKDFKKGDTISAYYKARDSFNKNYQAEYVGFYNFAMKNRRGGFIEMLCKYKSNHLTIFKITRITYKRTICTCRMVLVEKTLKTT